MKLTELESIPLHGWLREFNAQSDLPLLNALDAEIALSVIDEAIADSPWIYLAIALCHRAHARGELSLSLKDKPGELGFIEDPWPSLQMWEQYLTVFKPQEVYPVIYESDKLYLRRAWLAEEGLAKQVGELLHRELLQSQATTPDTLLHGCSEDQIAAIRAVHDHSFITLTGGPGTGKTFTILRCMANIVMSHPESHIAVAAPTGKAVSRLNTSIEGGLNKLAIDPSVKDSIPKQATTLHRLYQELKPRENMGIIPQMKPKLDWLFVDEASMVDLELLYQIFELLPKQCRIYLIGDIHQLASVRPGAVFRDIHEIISQSKTHAATSIQLRKTYRFSEDSSLHQLNECIRLADAHSQGQLHNIIDLSDTEVSLISNEAIGADAQIQRWIERHVIPFSDSNSLGDAFDKLSEFMILSATNQGPFGVKTLNDRIERMLSSRTSQLSFWKPILIERNDFTQKLYNGDVMVTNVGTNAEDLHYKRESENELKLFTKRQLPEHQTAYSITIHKSQGSEADHVLILLPQAESPLLTQELLYTAVSRARKSITIVGSLELLNQAIHQSTQRESSLVNRVMKQALASNYLEKSPR